MTRRALRPPNRDAAFQLLTLFDRASVRSIACAGAGAPAVTVDLGHGPHGHAVTVQ